MVELVWMVYTSDIYLITHTSSPKRFPRTSFLRPARVFFLNVDGGGAELSEGSSKNSKYDFTYAIDSFANSSFHRIDRKSIARSLLRLRRAIVAGTRSVRREQCERGLTLCASPGFVFDAVTALLIAVPCFSCSSSNAAFVWAAASIFFVRFSFLDVLVPQTLQFGLCRTWPSERSRKNSLRFLESTMGIDPKNAKQGGRRKKK